MMTNDNHEQERPWRAWLLRGIFLGAIAVGLWNGLEWSKVYSSLSGVSGWSILSILAAYTAVHILRFARFLSLMPSASWTALFAVTSLHVFYLRVLPFRSGELAYAFLLKRSRLGETGTGLAHLAFTRFLDIGSIALVASIGWALWDEEADAEILAGVSGALVAIMAASLLFLGAIFRGMARLTSSMAGARISWFQHAGAALSQSFSDAAECMDSLPRKRIAVAMSLTLVLWGCALWVMGLCLHSVFDGGNAAQVMLAGSTTIVASFLPLGIIGTFGVLEAGWVLGFTSVGIPIETATASALTYSILTLIGAGLFALIAQIWNARKS